ncbi:MAG: hypothetical protein JWO07_288 [Candidatus Saccharibacteria bacterium]|nr:hypothetical protein [Candidatus Saccharibacteria bacterium]
MQPQEPTDYDKPVAYDNEGRPLYAHPPTADASVASQAVGSPVMASPMTAQNTKRHLDSVKLFPGVDLSEEEFIISEVRRHVVGLLLPVIVAIILGLVIIFGLSLYPKLVPNGNPPFSSLVLPAVLLLALISLGTYIVIWVYQKNRLFITNESIIQQIQFNLFAHNEQTVDLSEVKDISYSQAGAFQMLLDYGTIILTTEGDGRTYTFATVTAPKKVVSMLNSVLEDFKNHRPVSQPAMVDTPVL